jgi:hypothetical protein
MNSTRAHQQQNTFSKNVVKRRKRVIFSQVIEKAKKINFKKCPNYPMQYDITAL